MKFSKSRAKNSILKSRLFIPISSLLLIFGMITVYTNCSEIPDEPITLSNISNISELSGIADPLAFIEDIRDTNLDKFNQACNQWDFIDVVVDNLRTEDDKALRFGYNCEEGICDNISKSQVAFYMGDQENSQSADKSSNVLVFNVIDDPCGSNPQVLWEEYTEEHEPDQNLVDICSANCDAEIEEQDCNIDSEEERCEDVISPTIVVYQIARLLL